MQIDPKIKRFVLILIITFACTFVRFFSEGPGLRFGWNQGREVLTLLVAGKTIVLDPGHGGQDPGATSPYCEAEKDVVLKIALYLKQFLEESGANVILTRDGDYDLADDDRPRGVTRKRSDLEKRQKIVEEANADLLVSIHVNSILSSRWSGAQTFYSAHLEENRLLAAIIQDALKENLGGTKREAKDLDAYILRTSQVPAVLVEVGFISNPREGRLLGQADYQRKVAYSIYKGISRYFGGQFRY